MAETTAKTTELPAAKRRQILAGARSAFTELGFERTSVDLVASRAGVSKATVYNHFHDKKSLFVACLSEEVDELRAGLRGMLGEPQGDVEDALRGIGERIVTMVLTPAVECLYRHTIADAQRFPEIGRILFERGPLVVQQALAAYLRRWHDAGALRIDDARTAAVQLAALCQGDLVFRAQLGVLPRPADDLILETVRAGVRTFLRAYRA
jgi:TetR/AcrR family transcriptional regulator, mexJK operon transcriptional repressor